MSVFPSIRIEGGLLGPDVLDQLLAADLPGQKPKDFGLDGRRSLTDDIASVFADARTQWEVFRRRLERLPENDPATSVTRDAWMIPFLSLLGYELRYNPRAYDVDGASFAISHRAGEEEDAPPVHIVGVRQELGRVAPTGQPRLAPHSLVQEFLNRTEQLWGIVTNGRTLRLLRDSTYIRRQAYVECDLEQILEDERFTDFAVLYRLLHRTRLPLSLGDARQCLLEQYYQHSLEQGGRVRERLRDGVEHCIKSLADGFLAHPANQSFRQRVLVAATDANRLAPEDIYRQLLRVVYRFLFLLVSEDRGLMSADPIYREHYGISRLRRLLDRRSAYTEHDDLWCSLRVLWKVLSDGQLAGLLGAAPLNGALFERLDLDDCTIANRDLLEAFWRLAYYQESSSAPPRRVNYAALDVEELGSVYESLLDYHPQIDSSGAILRFELAWGSERKATGSYYTPPALVAELIRSALEPVLEERLAEARRMANGEWRMVPKTIQERFAHDYSHRLSGSRGVETGDADRSEGLRADSGVSFPGDVRSHRPDAPGSDIGASQYRRGMGTPLYGGVHSVPSPSQRQPDRAGNSPDFEQPSRPLSGSGNRPLAGASGSPGEAVDQPGKKPPTEEELAIAWSRTPFAIRHSLFAQEAILSIRVLDPACGSGHFLLAAARRLGKELARVRTGEEEPAPEGVRAAIREVVTHCIYGVDKNPLAVELCRVALWLEAHCEGKPLTFLDHRIRWGDSLVGVMDLEVLKAGIPDEGFAPVSGDDKTVASTLKKQNRNERRDLASGQLRLPFDPLAMVSEFGREEAALEQIPDDSPELIRQKKQRYERYLRDPERRKLAQACDLWTAAFFQRMGNGQWRTEKAVTTQVVLDRLENRAHPQTVAEADVLAHRLRFFHWPLEFPEVFLPSPSGRGAGGEGTLPSPSGRGAGAEGTLPSPSGRGAGAEGTLPSPSGRGAGGEGVSHPSQPLPPDLLDFARRLRREQTDAEKLLWSLLRSRQFGGWKFRRQHPLPPYVLDFFCHELRLAIELDGGQHNVAEARRHDEQRTKVLADQGIKVLRFWNHEVLQATEAVLEALWQEATRRAHAPSPLTPLPKGEGNAPSPYPLPQGEGSGGGFDVVLCNPPWERIKLQEEEFFATRDPDIARAPNKAERGRRIRALQTANPALWQEYQNALHDADAGSKFLRQSARFPLTARGDINTYSVFAELFATLLRPEGRAGVVVPTGIATDATNQKFFAHLVASGRLASLYDFENREGLFPAVDSRYKFSLLTLQSPKANGEWRMANRGEAGLDHSPLAARHSPAQFAFFLTRAEQLQEPQRRFALTPEDFALLNPNTRTCPIFRTRQDAELTRAIYRRVPVLVHDSPLPEGEGPGVRANPWGVRFLAMFHMANDSHLFRRRDELEREGFRLLGNVFVKGDPHSPLATRYSPLYEAKMIWHYDHRYGTYEGVTSRSSTQLPTPDEAKHTDPAFLAQPWYWVPEGEVEARLSGWNRGWLLGWRDVTNATNERTAIFSLLPRVGVGHTMPLIFSERGPSATHISCFLGTLDSLVFDFVTRQKVGGTHLTYNYLTQLPVLPPLAYTPADLLFIVPRVLELVYTAWDLKPFADDVWADADEALREAIQRQWEAAPSPPIPLSHFGRGGVRGRGQGVPFPPFTWDEARRARLRAELDAYYARLYGLNRKQLRYILDPADLTERELADILDPWEEVADPLAPQGYAERVAKSTFPSETFRVLKEKELRQCGEYRTRRLVLEAWRAMDEPRRTGKPIAPRQEQGGEP